MPANRQTCPVDPSHPTVTVTLWRADAVVLFDWLNRTDLNTIPMEHPAEKQALTDLLARLEFETDVSVSTQADIDVGRAEVARDMGW
jgi:hypothetical protein